MKKLIACILVLSLCLCAVPLPALADGSTGINRAPAEAFLEHCSGGLWYDIDLPAYTLASGGDVCYSLVHDGTEPGSSVYTEANLSAAYSQTTVKGLVILMEYGYPAVTPSGMSSEEARQATAAAVFFWMCEQGEDGSSTYGNRLASPDTVRAKSGHASVLSFADELLSKARAQKELSHSIRFSDDPVVLLRNGSSSSCTDTVTLSNCSGGYTMETPASWLTVSGSTGHSGDTLSFSATNSHGGSEAEVTFSAKDSRTAENISLYVSGSGSMPMLSFENSLKTVASAVLAVSVQAYGTLTLKKYGPDETGLPGCVYSVYTDPDCRNLFRTVTSGSDGTCPLGEVPVGRYYVKEISVPSPLIVEAGARTVEIRNNRSTVVNYFAEEPEGIVHVLTEAPVISKLTKSSTPYGKLHTPVLETSGLAGAVYEIRDSGGVTVDTVESGNDGSAASKKLPLGRYSVTCVSVPDGYAKDVAVRNVTLSYKDQDTPVVTAEAAFSPAKLPASVKIRKLTESFNESTHSFEETYGAGFVFGLFTADANGILSKDTFIDLLTTDTDGTAESDVPLAFGNYYIRELAVPDRTIEIHEESFPLTVSGNNTYYYNNPVKNDMFKANIGIWLSDAASGQKLSGGTYEVRDEGGIVFCEMTTDGTGYALSVSLPAGTYTVRQTAAPQGYILPSAEFDVLITTDNKTTLVFEKTNAKNGFTVIRTDSVSGDPVPGVTVTVYDGSGSAVREITTGTDGQAVLEGLPAGSYTYADTAVPDGYTKDVNRKPFSVLSDGTVTGGIRIGTVVPTGLTVSARNAFSDTPFVNVPYVLLDAEGREIKVSPDAQDILVPDENGSAVFMTGSSGTAVLRYIPEGAYTLTESTPDGYISEAPFSVTLDDSTTVTAPADVESVLTITGLQITSTDSASGNPLSGIGFAVKAREGITFSTLTFSERADGTYLYDPDGSIRDLVADGSGRITVYGLPTGNLWLEETIRPDGYFPLTATSFELESEHTFDHPLQLSISSSKYIKLGLDSDWWEFPALCLGILLLAGAGIFLFLHFKKRRGKEEPAR